MKITDNLTFSKSRLLEKADTDAFAWIYQHLPDSYQQQFGFAMENLGTIRILLCQKIPFRHFTTPQGLGIVEPMTPQQLEDVLQVFEQKGINAFYIHTTPFCEPVDFIEQLVQKGMRRLSSWERIWRSNQPISEPVPLPEETTVEEISPEMANEWADFVDAVYRMNTKPWLLNLIGRAGFHAYVFRKNGKIAATRTMIIQHGNAWLGMDAPVPGVMAPTFEEDFFISQQLVHDGLRRGVKLFSTDIEKPSLLRDTPAYEYWANLGFEIAYLRDNYGF
ncbi:hypothetical protein [Runella sp.]|uniref:hypothetical protein n=1 Tax=Runella sp. TaxID=1960881 RepID=UPI003D0C9E90